MIDFVYVPKPPCPRNRGYWYCQHCVAEHLENASLVNYPVEIKGCNVAFDSLICGKTHLGYEWCQECKNKSRDTVHQHIGEYEVIAEYET